MPNSNPAGAGTFDFPLRFPGQYFDRETNLAYNMARDYSPDLGRYVEFDPIGLRGGINGYAYTGGNPLTRIDPQGTDIRVVAIIITGIAAAACIYTVYDCIRKCPGKCPVPPDDPDPEVEQQRNTWILKCKLNCVKAFGELCKGGPW